MYNIEREIEIIKKLEKDGKVSTADLARRFKTSNETIRRDLIELEKKNVIKRTYGGAILSTMLSDAKSLVQEYPESVRGIRNSNQKKQLCKEVASFIEDGDVVYIDNSTTCLYIVQNIPVTYHVTILSNSLRLLTEAANYDCTNKTFFCLGGSFNPSNLSTYNSDLIAQQKTEYYPDKCIISCMGISTQRMFTDGSYYEVSTKQKFIEQSNKVFVLADSSKIGNDGKFALDDGSNIDVLITDDKEITKKVKFPKNIKVLTI